MRTLDRRRFLQTTAASAAGLLAAHATGQAATGKSGWKKAFMLGQTEGPILPTFQQLKEAGFDGVELISPNKLDPNEVLKARDATGIIIHGVSGGLHWQKPLSHPDATVVRESCDAIRREIADCKLYGGTTVLIVPGVVTPSISHRTVRERSQAAIRELIPEAEKQGITLAIEEVWNRFLLTAPEFAQYIDDFQSPWVKAYFDVGNVVEYGYPQEWIHELGPRIAKIHIKEYAKKNRFSYALGDGGEIDWKAVRQALVEIGYTGWLTAEVGGSSVAEWKDVVERMDRLFPAA